jgi:tetratricopeptide (TPR) repeat protein
MSRKIIHPLYGLVLLACAHAALACAHDGNAAPNTRAAKHATDAAVGPDALAERGLSLLVQGDYVRAEQYLQLAVRAGHRDGPLIVPLLQTCVASGRLRAALMHADRYLGVHPRAWRIRYVKGAIHRALGQPETARLALQQARSDAPPEAHAWLESDAPSLGAEPAARPKRTRSATP